METCNIENFKDFILKEDTTFAVDFSFSLGLIKDIMYCKNCNSKMTLIDWVPLEEYQEEESVVWICFNPNIRCSVSSVREGSIFESPKISLHKWLHAMYLWSTSVNVTDASKKMGLSGHFIGKMYEEFRTICVQYFKNNPVKLGGPGDTLLDFDQLCRAGTNNSSAIIVYGFIEAFKSSPLSYLERIFDLNNKEKKSEIKAKVVEVGSVIPSPKIREQQEEISSYWNKHRNLIKNIHNNNSEGYLHQIMWFDRFGANAFFHLCEHIKSCSAS